MNKKIMLIALISACLLLSIAERFATPVKGSSDLAPNFTLTDIDGNVFSLSDYRGKVVLLDFFGTWCHPCVQQVSHLKDLYEKFGEKLVIISISPEEEQVLRDFRDQHGIEWTIARDTANVFDAYNIQYIPTLMILDHGGHIRYTHIGLTEEGILRSEIEDLLPKTIYVDDDNTSGPWDGTQEHPYQNITSALEHAITGDTIYVYNGTYYENVVVNKTVSLLGENKLATTIDGNMTDTVVSVTADDVTISEVTIRNGGNRYAGINLASNGINITNNIIWNNWCGISLQHHSAHNIIDNNSIMNNLNGISGELWSNSVIIGNTLKDNLLGIWIGPYSSHNTIAFNNINNHWSEGISMWQSSYNTLYGNNITDNNQGGHWAGIVVGFSSHNQFFHNNIANEGKQIDVQGEAVNTWDDGYPSGGNYWSDYNGTDLYSGPYQNESGSDGIGDTSYIINEFNQDRYPLIEPWKRVSGKLEILKPTNGSTIAGPVAITFTIENTGDFIEFLQGDPYNRIDLEIEYRSTDGEMYGWGIMFWSTSSYGLTLHSREKYEQTLVYDPSEYEEAVPPDFVGDAPYGKTTIRLVHWKQMDGGYGYGEFGVTEIEITITFPEDLNSDGKVDIRDIAIAAIAFGSYPGHPRWNPIPDINKDNKVDIRDIASIARNFGKVA